MKRWDWYDDARGSRYGDMRCTCGRLITEGEYRVREKPERYVVQHRACSADDPEWAKRDAARQQHAARNAGLLAAARAFRSLWEIDALDELIEDLGEDSPAPSHLHDPQSPTEQNQGESQ